MIEAPLTYPNNTIRLHDGDLDVLRTSLHHLQQRLDGKFDRVIAVKVVVVVLFQELAHSFGGASNGGSLELANNRARTHLPCRVDSTGLGLEKMRLRVVGVKSHNQGRDTKGTNTSRLGIPLLDASNVLGDILDGRWVLDSKAVRLTFDTRLVDQNSTISSQTWMLGAIKGVSHQQRICRCGRRAWQPCELYVGLGAEGLTSSLHRGRHMTCHAHRQQQYRGGLLRGRIRPGTDVHQARRR